MEINVSSSPEGELRASDQALMEAFRQLMIRGRKIRLAKQAKRTLPQSDQENEADPESACTHEQS